MQNFRALGGPLPDPRASGGCGLCPKPPCLRQLGASPPDPIGLRWLGAPRPDPQTAPPIANFRLRAWLYRYQEAIVPVTRNNTKKKEAIFQLVTKPGVLLLTRKIYMKYVNCTKNHNIPVYEVVVFCKIAFYSIIRTNRFSEPPLGQHYRTC